MKKIILYHSNLLKFGGVDTFVYNMIKRLKSKYDILFLYSSADTNNLNRIRKEVEVEKYNSKKQYICDTCIVASAWGGYPDSVISINNNYIQMIHADYIKMREMNFIYHKWYKTTVHIGVSDFVCKQFKKLYPEEEIIRIYNILDHKQETKPILKLISATRLSKEKGYDRMVKLANILKENNIKFRWTIFTDLKLYGVTPMQIEGVEFRKPTFNLWDYLVEADYGVQLSDTEGYSYFINECLQYGTPVISTNFPSSYESVEDGVNGYIVDMDLSNLDIDKIVNHIPNSFIYKEKTTEKVWEEMLNQKRKRGNEMFKIIAKQNYTDTKPEFITEGIKEQNEKGAQFKKGDIYYINNKERASIIKVSNLAEVEEIKEESEIETAKIEKKTIETKPKKETATNKTSKTKAIKKNNKEG